MRKLGLLIPLVLVAVVALADEYNAAATLVQGTGIQTATNLIADNDYAIQCPNIDGGAGQKVFYRPGGCSNCVADAGLGDILIDFSTATGNPDPYYVRLRAGSTVMDRIHLRGFSASDSIFCTVAPKSRSR